MEKLRFLMPEGVMFTVEWNMVVEVYPPMATQKQCGVGANILYTQDGRLALAEVYERPDFVRAAVEGAKYRYWDARGLRQPEGAT